MPHRGTIKEEERGTMRVIKRNGAEVEFDIIKIIAASASSV